MLVITQPLYPLLIIDPKGWLGWRTHSQKIRFSLYGALNTKRWVGFDGSGAKWRVSPDSFRYPDKWWTRLLANTIYNPRFDAELHWQGAGQYTFQELQDEICSLLDRDDDLLTQVTGSEAAKKVVRGCKSFDELTAKLRRMKVIRQ